MWYNLTDLKWQYEWQGTTLQNLRKRVCTLTCLDVPQPQLKAKLLPGADPVPVKDPRPEWFASNEIDFMTTTPGPGFNSNFQPNFVGSDPMEMTTVDGMPMIRQPMGPGLRGRGEVSQEGLALFPNQPALFASIQAGVKIPFVTITTHQVGFAQNFGPNFIKSTNPSVVSVTTSLPHNLQTGSQIGVLGLAQKDANGYFSVTVWNPTLFQYQVNAQLPSGSLVTGSTIMSTIYIIPPNQMAQIPQDGIG